MSRNKTNAGYNGPDLYHYTDKKGADGIQKTGVIKSTKPTPKNLERDLLLGPGVYLTSKAPHNHSKEEILRGNYSTTNPALTKGRADYHFKMSSKELNKMVKSGEHKILQSAVPGREDIYVLQNKKDQAQQRALSQQGFRFAYN